MTNQPEIRTVNIDPEPKGKLKDIAGSNRDEWNSRLANLVVSALPDQSSKDIGTAAVSGMVEMKPADPMEGCPTVAPGVQPDWNRVAHQPGTGRPG
jgi:hypothetical protein